MLERSGKMDRKAKSYFRGIGVVGWGVAALMIINLALAAIVESSKAEEIDGGGQVGTISAIVEPLKASDPEQVEMYVAVGQPATIPLIRERLLKPLSGTLTWHLYTGAPTNATILATANETGGTLYSYVSFSPTAVGTYPIEAWADNGSEASTYPLTYVIKGVQPLSSPTSVSSSSLTATTSEVSPRPKRKSLRVKDDSGINSVGGGNNLWTPSLIADSHIGAEYNSVRAHIPNPADLTRASVHLVYFSPPTASDGSAGTGDLLYSLSIDTGQSWRRYPIPGTNPALYNSADPTTFLHKFDLNDPLTYVNYVIASGDGLLWWEVPAGSPDVQVGQYTSLALDASGVPHMAHYDILNQDLLHTWQSGSHNVTDVNGTIVTVPDFTTEVVDATGNVGLLTSIAVDTQGTIHISYRDQTNGALKYTRKPAGGSWGVRSLAGGDLFADNKGFGSSVATYTAGVVKVGIAYFDFTNKDLLFIESTDGGITFGAPVVLDSTGDVGRNPSLAYDKFGKVGVAYRDATNGDLKFVERDIALTWGTPIAVDSGIDTDPIVDGVTHNVGQFASLSYDTQPTETSPMITYHDATKTSARFAERLRIDESPPACTNGLSGGLPCLRNLSPRWVGVELKEAGDSVDPTLPLGKHTSIHVSQGNHVFTAFQNLASESVDMQKSFSSSPPMPDDDGDIEEANNHKPEIAKIQDKVNVEIDVGSGCGTTRDLLVTEYVRDIDLEDVGGVISGRDPITLTAQIRYDNRLTPTPLPRNWVTVGPYTGADAVNELGQPNNGTNAGPFCFPPVLSATPYFCQVENRDVSDGTKSRGVLKWRVTANTHTGTNFNTPMKHEIRFVATSPNPNNPLKPRKDKEKIKIRTWKYVYGCGSGGGGNTGVIIDDRPRWMELW